jgi:hypothetical protein
MQPAPRACLVILVALAATVPNARASEPPREAVLAELPFEAGAPDRVVVDLAPEGSAKPFPLFLDTGASWSVLTPRMARELGVKVRRLKTDPYRRETRLGRDLQFWIDDRSSDTASRTGWEYGLLGGQFLAEYVVEIDFSARRVRFLDPERWEVPESAGAEGESVLPIRLVSNCPSVEVVVDGRPVLVTVDTGAPSTAIFSAKAFENAGVAWTPLAPFEFGTTVGPMKVELTEVAELRVGAFALGPAYPVFVSPRGWYNAGIESESVIGYELLSAFVLRIDYPRRRLWMRRSGETRATVFGMDYAELRRSGVLLSSRLGWHRIAYVYPGSLAEQRGLRAGDRIERVGRNPGGLTEQRILRAISEGQAVTVERKVEGEQRMVTLDGAPATTAPATPAAGD